MGHTRLGELPKSRKWKAVVAGIVGSSATGGGSAGGPPPIEEDIERIAATALDAAKAGLDKGIRDPGLRYTFYLLTQIVLAAREPNWQERLARVGIRLSHDSSLFDLTAQMQHAIDEHLHSRRGATDISEIAQRAAGEAVVTLAETSSRTLFGAGREELLSSLRELSTKAGFSRLGQCFFGRFMARFLNFYLSRATASNVGSARLSSVREVAHFDERLQLHCEQSARIIHDFCGGWYSKTEFQEGITEQNTSRFMAVAMRKLQSELQKQGAA